MGDHDHGLALGQPFSSRRVTRQRARIIQAHQGLVQQEDLRVKD
ncbi:hypothetical protein [Lactobacillus delbrueckii]|nr:hypothetical protein [Lactobacillus delbrueckii]